MANQNFRAWNLSKNFGAKKVFEQVSIEASLGERIQVSGSNGVGKTTLLKCLAGILVPESGQIDFLGEDLAVAIKKGQVAWAGCEDRGFFPNLTGRANLELFADLWGVTPKLNGPAYAHILETPYFAMSSGMKQLLSFVRATLHGPKLLFLDEPLKSLDGAARNFVLTELEVFRSRGAVVFFSAHDEHSAIKADKIVSMGSP